MHSEIRLSDDLADPEALTDNGFADSPSSYPPHRFRSQPQVVDRSRGQWDWQREREKEKERERERERQREQERERERQRILALERDNALLVQRVSQLEQELQSTRHTMSTLNFLASPGPSASLPPGIPSSPPADPTALRNAYEALLSSYNLTQHALSDRAEEVTSLQSFLTKTDDFSGAQLIQALRDLNSEIVHLAASVAEEFGSSMDRRVDLTRQSDRELVTNALGPVIANLLASREHTSDPTLVQFAVQAWEIVCIGRVLESFCFGLPPDVDQALSRIFHHMHLSEPQPTTSRWRALTHSHARALIASSSPPSSRSPSPFQALTESNLRGLLAILAIAGCTDPRAIHRDPLRERFGASLNRIGERVERLAVATKEGVMSAAFDVVWLGPSKQAPHFDSGMMDNVYAGHGNEQGNVLCTVEFGLMCVRRVGGAGEGETNGNGNGVGVPTNGVKSNDAVNGYAKVNGHGHAPNGSAKVQTGDGVMARSLLLKPKVLLDSVAEIL
ncbi:unnamed protein product [Somion occarium]|uniref:Uncharacterized protein n=1 Tax=Somion occarium TaxID=3059160 RepID=A0ABP1EBI5_9APHY